MSTTDLAPSQPPIEAGDATGHACPSHDIITVVRDPEHSLGKRFELTADGQTKKTANVQLSLGIATMHRVDTTDDLKALLSEVSNDSHAALINAVFNGIEVGEEFLIVSSAKLEELTGIPQSDRERQAGVHDVKYAGKPYKAVCRFKENVTPSSLQYGDRDNDMHTPESYASVSLDEYRQHLDKLLPGIAETTLVHAPSTSSRVLRNGKPVGGGNGHLWFKVKHPSDIERFRTAILVRAAELGMTWKKPRYSRTEPGKVVGHSLSTIVDTSVFTPGRLTFTGKPVATDAFEVAPADIRIIHGRTDRFDTTQVKLPEKDKVREITAKAGVEMSLSGSGLTLAVDDLTLETELDTQHQGVLTVRDLIEQGVKHKIRCQTPFRDSSSYAAFFSCNEDGQPFVHDTGTNTTHWLDQSGRLEVRNLINHARMQQVLTRAEDDCGAPFEPDSIRLLSQIRQNSIADYQRYRQTLKQTKGVSVTALDKAVRDFESDSDSSPYTHHGYATKVIENLTVDQARPVGHAGSLYVYDPDQGIYQAKSDDEITLMVAETFDGYENCAKGHEYKAIAQHATSMVTDDSFFEETPVGLACPQGFIRLDGDTIRTEPLTPQHRQRVKTAFSPEDKPIPLYEKFLAETFAADDSVEQQEQIHLLQEVMGAMMLGIQHQYQKAILFYEPFGRAGKGVEAAICQALVPSQYISAVSPFLWNREYHIASLAGQRLNVVGELPDHDAIPAAAFKTVTGGDALNGRHPNHRPFTFKCEAAHLFMSNHLINTKDHSEAFFSRWLIIFFPNSRLRSGLPLDPNLPRDIIAQELPGIAYWALQGAKRLVRQGHFSSSRAHDRLMSKWRMTTNSLEEFINECCDLGDKNDQCFRIKRSSFYQSYSQWCRDSERRPFSKGRVLELLNHNLRLNIEHARINGYELFVGVKLKDDEPFGKKFL